MNKANTVEEYIGSFPNDLQKVMQEVRKTILKNAPDAVESISYGMPAYKLHGKPLVYFAGYKHHIGFHATPSGHTAFSKELYKYKQGKGSVQFPLDQPMPLKLIAEIVKYRVEENGIKSGKK